MIPSHTKVAWAFLDRMLGRTPPPRSNPGALTNAQRNAILDKSLHRLARQTERALEIGAKRFAKQVITESKKLGIDPQTTFRRLMLPRKFWPRMQKRPLQWLDLMSSALVWTTNFPFVGKQKEPAELRPVVDQVLMNLGDWSYRNLKPFFEKAYLESLQKEARNLVPVYDYPEGADPTLPNTTLALMHEFEFRLDHARLPVGNAQMLFRLLSLFT